MRYLLQISVVFLALSLQLLAQKEGYIWYFGQNAGLDFNFEPPVALVDGAMNTVEGCAVISDYSGKLLFYTDGMTIWNKDHKPMPNGSGLDGDWTSTQSAVIVPNPSNKNLYYVFTVDDQAGPKGFRYSIVDITLDGGKGDVTNQKNILLQNSVTEKVTAVWHKNKLDVWIITHDWNSDVFRAFLVTSSGISPNPVTSRFGSVHTGDLLNNIGYLKVSPKGNKLALAIYDTSIVEIFDFNNSTGLITNPVSMQYQNYSRPYGIEFSADGSKLYVSNVSNPSTIRQFDLLSGNASQIIASGVDVISIPVDYYFAAMQLGPDGKIYIARYKTTILDVINDPNLPGKNSNYKGAAISLNGRVCKSGLPTFIQSYFQPDSIGVPSSISVCEGDTIFLSCSVIPGVNYTWTGPNGFVSVVPNPKIPNATLDMSGVYFLKAELPNRWTANLSVEVRVFSHPKVKILHPGSLVRCFGDSILLKVDNPDSTLKYYWSTGDSSLSLIVKFSGMFVLNAVNMGACTGSDTVDVVFSPPAQASIGNDKGNKLCSGDTAILTAYPIDNSFRYLWSTGDTSGSIKVTQSGKFSVEIINAAGCKSKDSTNISVAPKPVFSILPESDNVICSGDSITLSVSDDFAYYLWSSGDSTKIVTVKTPGVYKVVITDNNGCSSTDSATVVVRENEILSSAISFDTVCSGNDKLIKSKFTNTAQNQITISSIKIKNYAKAFTFSPSLSLPRTLEPGEEFEITLIFIPDDFLEYKDSIIIETSLPCTRYFFIPVTGIGKPDIVAWLPDTAGTIGNNMIIPLKARINTSLNKSVIISYRAEVCFNTKALYNIDAGNCSGAEGYSRLTFEGSNVTISNNETTLAEISGLLLLPDSMTTALKLVSFTTDLTNSCTSLIDGSLKLNEVCQTNLRQVKFFNPATLSIEPNPSSGKTQVKLHTNNNNFSLNIYDIEGRKLKSSGYALNPVDKGNITINFETDDLAGGYYNVMLQSTDEVVVKPLLIFK